MKTLNRLDRKSVISPVILTWFIFVSLFGKCTAQNSGIGFAVPFTIMIVGCSLFCFCFWICFAAICYRKQQENMSTLRVPPNTTTTPQYTFNLQRQPNSDYPQSQTSEPVSLSEATLHQGDAPPAYEEAIGMKTVRQNHAVHLP